MKQRILSALQYIVFLGGGIFLIWWQFKDMTAKDKEEFYNAFTSANYWLLIPVAIMSLLSHLSRAMRWKLLMEPLGYKPALKNLFSVTMIGYLANAAVPRLGEILKCTFLARYEKLKTDKLVGTILVERTFDFICYLVFIAITILLQADVIGGSIKEKFEEIANAPGMPVWAKLLLLAGAVIGFMLIMRLLVKKYPQNKIILKISGIVKGLGQGFATIKNLKNRKLFLAHTVFIWAMYLLQVYIGFSAMQGTEHLGIKAAFSVLTLATLAMIATPGGIGVFPVFVMKTLMIYNIAKESGQAFGWLIWGASTSIVIIAGFSCLLLLPYINKQKNETGQLDTQ
jgi:glycosyltransferase 2 family protein